MCVEFEYDGRLLMRSSKKDTLISRKNKKKDTLITQKFSALILKSVVGHIITKLWYYDLWVNFGHFRKKIDHPHQMTPF